MPSKLVFILLLVLGVRVEAAQRARPEWRTLYFFVSGSTITFQEEPDQKRTEDCSKENYGRPCSAIHWVKVEPCVVGTANDALLRRLLAGGFRGKGEFLVETLPAPWSKLTPEFYLKDPKGDSIPIDSYALVRGIRVTPKCEEAKSFYWVRDFRSLKFEQ